MWRQVSTIAHKITFAFCTQFEAFRLICNFQLETSVLSVDRAKWKPAGSAKKAPPIEGFEIVLEDTVLFPEGGGQGLVDAIHPLATHQPQVHPMQMYSFSHILKD